MMRCRLYCEISKGSARAGWYPVPGGGPFAGMTLGGTRSAGIPLSGTEDAKPILTLGAHTSSPPPHTHARTFCGNQSVKPQGLPRSSSSRGKGRTRLSDCCSAGSACRWRWERSDGNISEARGRWTQPECQGVSGEFGKSRKTPSMVLMTLQRHCPEQGLC